MTDDILPTKYADQGLADLTETTGNAAALDWCRRWIAGDVDRAQGLVLVGDPGTGKTTIAAALAHDALDVGLQVGFTSSANLRDGLTRQMDLMEIIRKLDVVTEDTEELIEHRSRHERLWHYRFEDDLLVLDDLGRESKSNSGRYIEEQMDNLLRNRGDAGLATVITSNLTVGQRTARYGEPMMSYLAGVCDWIEVRGGDWRRGEG